MFFAGSAEQTSSQSRGLSRSVGTVGDAARLGGLVQRRQAQARYKSSTASLWVVIVIIASQSSIDGPRADDENGVYRCARQAGRARAERNMGLYCARKENGTRAASRSMN